MLRSEWPNVSPIFGCTWIWLMPFQLVLDRVLGGDDLRFVALDLQQRAVERGALAGAGRAGHQDDPVRQADQLAGTGRRGPASMPSFASENCIAPLSSNPQHDAFAVDHRDHGDADVDLAAGHAQLDAAVLRQAPLGDVQPRHDLQAG